MVSGNNRYKVHVEDVFSGDDLLLRINLGISGISVSKRCRLLGVDAPDAFQKSSDTPEGKVRDTVKDALMKRKCEIEVHKEDTRSLIVTLYYRNGDTWCNLNDELIGMGFVFVKKPKESSEWPPSATRND